MKGIPKPTAATDEERGLKIADYADGGGASPTDQRTNAMTPAEAAAFLRRLPEEGGFSPQKVATIVERLPEGTGQTIQFGKSSSQASLGVAIPGDPKLAFEWARELMAATLATSVKMNFGPDKPTDLKIFWGKPEVNTLVEIGGRED